MKAIRLGIRKPPAGSETTAAERGPMMRKAVQLGLIHMAVAVTLVPINSTLNRIMIKELSLSATLVVLLASLPYLFSPLQVAIGSYSDTHPVLGRRRSPYILVGLLLCAAGLAAAPVATFLMARRFWLGLGAAAAAFGAWGMGYNFAAVSYLSLASEVSGPGTKGRTLAVMWSLMICGIIATSMILGRLLAPYSEQVLARSFLLVAAVALLIGCAAVLRLEEPEGRGAGTGRARAAHEGAQARSWRQLLGRVLKNPQAVLFLVYLTVLLSAIFGQDLLLEPFAGEALDIPVSGTTRLTAIWGACFLVSMALGSALERRVAKKRMAAFGAGVALTALLVLVGAGYLQSRGLFYAGTVLLGLGSGLSTLANLSLMLDMILPGSEGLYMGLWGIASAVSRVAGAASGAVLRDLLGASRPLTGYAAAFFLLAGFLVVSLVLLPRIDVARFQARARASLRSPDARVFEALD